MSTGNSSTLTIGISGKRDIPLAEKAFLTQKIENKIREILLRNNTTHFIGYTALATGTDTLFAEVVTNIFKMPLNVLLPMPVEEYTRNFTTQEASTLYDYLEKSAETIIASDNTIYDNEGKKEAYLHAGKCMVNICDEMIFIWDEMKPAGKGGTAEIMGYYSEKKRQTTVDYIPVSAATNDQLNSEIINAYKLSNSQAIINRDKYKLIWKLAIFLGWLAVIVFSINTAFDTYLSEVTQLIGTCVEFVLVSTVFCLIVRANAKDYHGHYLKERFQAETLRLLKYFYHANIEIKISELASINDKKIAGIVENINLEIKNTPYLSKWYANYAIKSLIQEQIQYHSAKEAFIGDKYHFREKLNRAIALFFMINLLAHLIMTLLHGYSDIHIPYYLHKVAICFAIFLPATYAAIEGILHFNEWARLKKYSSSVRKNLGDTLKGMPENIENIKASDCFDQQSLALNLIANIILTGNKNWNLVFEDKNNYHWVI